MNKLPVSAADFIGAIAKTTQRLGSGQEGMSYLKLSKGGFWIYGVDDIEVEDESQWAINPNSLAVGYVAWPIHGTGKPLGEEMRGITDDPIIESRLPDVGPNGAWNQQVGMQLLCISGEDTGTACVFKASSKGGLGGFNKFLNEVMSHFQENPNTALVVPVVELLVDDYKHPTYGKIYTPVFDIKKWVPIDEMPEADEPEAEPEPEPKARRGRGDKAESKAEPKAEDGGDDKPPRRRRRRGA